MFKKIFLLTLLYGCAAQQEYIYTPLEHNILYFSENTKKFEINKNNEWEEEIISGNTIKFFKRDSQIEIFLKQFKRSNLEKVKKDYINNFFNMIVFHEQHIYIGSGIADLIFWRSSSQKVISLFFYSNTDTVYMIDCWSLPEDKSLWQECLRFSSSFRIY
jgi:hypothetical protein